MAIDEVSAAKKQRFVVLDGLRGAAAMMVLILHTAFIFPSASLAVDFFFMLSGFVLAHGYGDRLRDGHDRKQFVIARLIRLWPLYLLGCAIALPACAGMALFHWSFWNFKVLLLATVTAPFFILLPYDVFSIPLNPPGWSLSFELMANAVFLFVGTRLRWAVGMTVAWAALLVWAVYLYHGGSTGWTSFWGSFPRVFFAFFCGVLLYRAWQGQWLPRISVAPWMIIVALIAICAWDPPKHRIYYAVVLLVLNPTLIWLGACSTARGALERVCVLFGDLSYGVYVLHVPIIMVVEGLRFLLMSGNAATYVPTGATWWLTQPIALGVAYVLTYRFDAPVRRALARRFLARGGTKSSVPVSGAA